MVQWEEVKGARARVWGGEWAKRASGSHVKGAWGVGNWHLRFLFLSKFFSFTFWSRKENWLGGKGDDVDEWDWRVGEVAAMGLGHVRWRRDSFQHHQSLVRSLSLLYLYIYISWENINNMGRNFVSKCILCYVWDSLLSLSLYLKHVGSTFWVSNN